MTDTSYADAMARALAASDEVGLSDGSDRPASSVDTVLDRFSLVIDDLAEAGYSPIDTIADPTVDYFARRGWEAVRHNGDSISFARWGDDGARILTTSKTGAIRSEATFSADRNGLHMFTVAAALFPS